MGSECGRVCASLPLRGATGGACIGIECGFMCRTFPLGHEVNTS